MLKCFNLETKPNDVINLTDDIKQFVAESGIQSGECIVFNPHTTAGLTITSFWDPAGFEDLQDEICRLIPPRPFPKAAPLSKKSFSEILSNSRANSRA